MAEIAAVSGEGADANTRKMQGRTDRIGATIWKTGSLLGVPPTRDRWRGPQEHVRRRHHIPTSSGGAALGLGGATALQRERVGTSREGFVLVMSFVRPMWGVVPSHPCRLPHRVGCGGRPSS